MQRLSAVGSSALCIFQVRSALNQSPIRFLFWGKQLFEAYRRSALPAQRVTVAYHEDRDGYRKVQVVICPSYSPSMTQCNKDQPHHHPQPPMVALRGPGPHGWRCPHISPMPSLHSRCTRKASPALQFQPPTPAPQPLQNSIHPHRSSWFRSTIQICPETSEYIFPLFFFFAVCF